MVSIWKGIGLGLLTIFWTGFLLGVLTILVVIVAAGYDKPDPR